MVNYFFRLTSMAVLALALTSCCNKSFSNGNVAADRQAERLRMHFLGHNVADISTLISETREVSAALKKAGMDREARKFDSYTDVLMFGNNTLAESLNDVMELVKGNTGDSSKCPCLNEALGRLF
ncbi:MAG: hypothetical protein LBJ16_00135 [Holosporaceae bacterium]|nr:hypothetical protein [Holosporaceae bacterium]